MSEISTSPKSAILSRLESLRAKRKEAQKLNRQELFQHSKNQRVSSLKSKKENKLKEFDDYQDEPRETGSKKWHVKKQHDGSANFNDLAESTYYKNIDKLKIDKEAYKAQKESLIKKHGVDEEELTSVVDLSNQPDAKTKVQVVSFLSEANDKRMKRRRNDKDEQDVDSFINEKNKQFNMKLNRQVNKADR